MGSNTVFLKDMPFMLEVGKDAWLREGKVQPVNISLRVNVSSIDEAATSDDVSKCLDYGKLYKDIQWNLKDSKCADVQTLAWQVITSVEAKFTPVTSEITLPKAVRGAEGGIKHILEVKYGTEFDSYQETLHIRDVKCACIIGINQHERRHKQMVVVNATLRAHERTPKWKGEAPDFHRTWIVPEKSSLIIEAIVKRVEGSSFQTVEALANAICRDVMIDRHIPEIEVSIEKPYAIPSIGAAGVCIRRRRSFYPDLMSNEHNERR